MKREDINRNDGDAEEGGYEEGGDEEGRLHIIIIVITQIRSIPSTHVHRFIDAGLPQ